MSKQTWTSPNGQMAEVEPWIASEIEALRQGLANEQAGHVETMDMLTRAEATIATLMDMLKDTLREFQWNGTEKGREFRQRIEESLRAAGLAITPQALATTPGEEMSEWSDGEYPTQTALARIREWPYTDWRGLMDFVRSLWWPFDGYGWIETKAENDEPHFKIATCGWSGNENMIGALEDNRMFWMLCWRSSHRGGGFEFQIPYACSTDGARVEQKSTEPRE